MGIQLKPVSGPQLRQAVDAALASTVGQGADADSQRQRQGDIIRRLIVEGPDALVFHVYRRLHADRTRSRGTMPADVLTWTEIAEWAKREGVLEAEQASLLRHIPLADPQKAGDEPA